MILKLLLLFLLTKTIMAMEPDLDLGAGQSPIQASNQSRNQPLNIPILQTTHPTCNLCLLSLIQLVHLIETKIKSLCLTEEENAYLYECLNHILPIHHNEFSFKMVYITQILKDRLANKNVIETIIKENTLLKSQLLLLQSENIQIKVENQNKETTNKTLLSIISQLSQKKEAETVNSFFSKD